MTDEEFTLQLEYDDLLLKGDKSPGDLQRMLEIEAALARMFGPYCGDDE